MVFDEQKLFRNVEGRKFTAQRKRNQENRWKLKVTLGNFQLWSYFTACPKGTGNRTQNWRLPKHCLLQDQESHPRLTRLQRARISAPQITKKWSEKPRLNWDQLSHSSHFRLAEREKGAKSVSGEESPFPSGELGAGENSELESDRKTEAEVI